MVKKEIWGTATWYLFHTLSYKLKHDNEQQVKTLYNHFKNFCNHLPCPICKEHAMRFLAKVNDNNIKTKDNLIIIMFTFHNEVNRMTNSNIFTMEEHNKLYDKANTDNMVKYFINVWSYKNGTGYQGIKENSFSKQQCINKFKSYISKNRNLFN